MRLLQRRCGAPREPRLLGLSVSQLFGLVLVSMLSACSSTVSLRPPVISAPAVSRAAMASAPATVPAAIPVTSQGAAADARLTAPPAPREFRAAWVSTVSNVDWPSRKNLSSAQQKAEIIAILDTAAQLKLNAIVLQVRPSADAIYPSKLEPWSEFLSGEQGKAPNPFYDPLQFWIEQAHLRGLELHAWFNPYRAKTASAKSALTYAHFNKIAPAAIKRYGDLWWLDPGEPAALQHTLAVVSDVLQRYDVDGIHLDDYFYPYPIKTAKGAELDFPDEASWNKYRQQAGTLNRADWRRHNVNRLVEAIHQRVHQEKSWVKFGISPFGIGRPDRLPAGIKGFSQYDKLYTDVELWLDQGWIDYLAPQLYWPLAQDAQAFRVLRAYWLGQNPQARHIWPGLATNSLEHAEKSWPAEEILQQIDATRAPAANANSNGHLHFSISALMQNRKNIRQRLMAEKYQDAALVPASPWLGKSTMSAPQLSADQAQKTLHVKLADSVVTNQLAIWKRYEQKWIFSLQTGATSDIHLSDDAHFGRLKEVVVSSVSRIGQESPRSSYQLR